MKTMENSLQRSFAYLPHFPPPKNTKPSYERFIQSAPLNALADVNAHSKKPVAFQSTVSRRARVQVGHTNRWRINTQLGSDLLGTSQAIRAVESSRGKREIISTDDIASRLLPSDTPYTQQRFTNSGRTRNGVRSAPPTSKCDRHRYRTSFGLKQQRAVTALDLRRERSTSCSADDWSLTSRHIRQVQQSHFYIPPDKRQPTPVEVLLRTVHIASRFNGIDLIVSALNTHWNLHLQFAQDSGLLSRTIRKITEREFFDENIAEDDTQNDCLTTMSENQGVSVSIHRIPTYPRSIPVFVDLKVEDELITKHAFASALCFLYDNKFLVDHLDAVNILAASHYLQIDSLKERCGAVMINNIDATNACLFYSAACKYDIMAAKDHCEKWLEIHVIPRLSSSMYLAHLSNNLLEKLLKSRGLFSFNEYAIFRLLCNWVFLRENNSFQILPKWETIVISFMSNSDTASFLETEEGQKYVHLFRHLRLNGITDSNHLDEIIKMNIFPSQWLLKVFAQHYFSLQGGGDMSLLMKFDEYAVRFGYILSEADRSFSELLSLHGFHFDVHVDFGDDNRCLIFMQRLRPTDPVSSQKVSDRQTLSIRQDREVRYAIRAQYFDGVSFKIEQLGPKSQGFGLGNKTEKSEVLKITSPVLPLYVTFCLLFPPT